MRNRSYYRHHRNRVIKKKMKRVKLGFWYITPGKEGSLSKGKTHCSCWMCTTKTKIWGWHKNDQVKIDAMKQEIKEFFEKETD